MTWKEMYVDYQPWITLIYLSIFISPFIGIISYKKIWDNANVRFGGGMKPQPSSHQP